MTQPAPLIGALLRIPWQHVREELLADLHARGYDDLVLAHLDVLQYPGPDGRRPSDLARDGRMSKQALNYLLRQLEERGYLVREPDPDDQRSRVLRLTARGRAASKTMRATVRRVERQWARELGEEEFARLRELLAELGVIVGIAGPR